jgi:hypothetical protein
MTQTPPLQYLYSEEIYKTTPKLLIVIDKDWTEVTSDEKILLDKILKALKLSLASVQIQTRREFSIGDFKVFTPSFVLAFGSKLKNSDKMYEEVQMDGTSVVVADALDQLNDVLKRNLWLTLKESFAPK